MIKASPVPPPATKARKGADQSRAPPNRKWSISNGCDGEPTIRRAASSTGFRSGYG